MRPDPIRLSAWRILCAVDGGGSLDRELEPALSDLPPERRPFLAELVKGALVMQGRYDHLVLAYSKRPKSPPARLAVLLRLGLHQLLACDSVPAYAAVDESVKLARRVLDRGKTGYVNALLKAVARDLDAAGGDVGALKRRFPDPRGEPAAYLSTWLSHPRWLVERWLDRYGFDAARDLCRHDNRPAPLNLHVLPPHDPETVAASLRDAGLAVRAGRLDPRALTPEARMPRDELRRLLVERPELMVQDESVQAATRWLLDGAGAPLVDLCAAPGGKALAARSRLGPSCVTAMDLRPRRLGRLSESLARTGLDGVHLLAGDAGRPPLRSGVWASVLLDGPCSGTGVIRRHAEGRWRLTPDILKRNARRLRRLGRAAFSLLAPGGRLLYATCSLEPEENESVVEALAAGSPDLFIEARRGWRPHEEGGDGFFAARLRRKGGS